MGGFLGAAPGQPGEPEGLEPGLREKWGKGKEWTKIWWVWQKLEDRYASAGGA